MATKKNNNEGAAGGVLNAAKIGNEENETAADTPAVVFKNGFFHTPDGSRFNTRLKAEKHLESWL